MDLHNLGDLGNSLSNLGNVLWNTRQDGAIGKLNKLHKETGKHTAHLQALSEENQDLRLCLSVLLHMLVDRGLFQPADFAAAVTEARAKASQRPVKPEGIRPRPTRLGKQPPEKPLATKPRPQEPKRPSPHS